MAGRLTISTLNDDTGVLATQNGMTGIAKAWVNFNGTGTVAIRDSFNVSSITDNGTGDYTVNFTTAMPNTNFAQNISALRATSGNCYIAATYSVTTASTRFSVRDSSTFVVLDVDNINVAVFSS
jgi:hypothetical protein